MTRSSKRLLGLGLVAGSALTVGGCAFYGPGGPIFDVAAEPPQAQTTKTTETSVEAAFAADVNGDEESAEQVSTALPDGTEAPVEASANTLLGTLKTGPGYQVSEAVTSDGRSYIYAITGRYGAYSIRGNALMEKHLRELLVLHELKEKNEAVAFARGAGNAVFTPVKTVVETVVDPISAGKNVANKVKSVAGATKRGVQSASAFVANQGRVKPKVAKREKDGLMERFSGRSELKRQLAFQYGVDPYTHFLPLERELDEIASFSTVGQLGVKAGLSFVPGAAGFVVSGITRTSQMTGKVLDRPPSSMALLNRKRLEERDFSTAQIDRFILNRHYTPTEKTLLIGWLLDMPQVAGYRTLLDHSARTKNRADAWVRGRSLGLTERVLDRESKQVSYIEIVEGHPVVFLTNGRVVVIGSYDHLSWTADNKRTFESLTKTLGERDVVMDGSEVIVSGDITDLGERSLKALGWRIRTEKRPIAVAPVVARTATDTAGQTSAAAETGQE
ncbi:MAG: hypothetical protein AAGF59_00810 [Pseudomonadota bacterium]